MDIEATTDAGGGYGVGWTTAGEWLGYTVNVTSAGTYTVHVRVASSGAGGTFHLEVGGANLTGTMTVPDTGGWQSWQTIRATATLSAGTQVMRLVMDAVGTSAYVGNFNWLAATAGATCTPSCSSRTCGSDGCGGTCGGCPPSQMCGAGGTCETRSGSGIVVDASSQLTPISPDIYGIAFADDESAKVTTLNRAGGDADESYNWEKDLYNSGAWWNCANYGGQAPSRADALVQASKARGQSTLLTIPITGWVANVLTTSDSTYSPALGQPLSYCNYPVLPDGKLLDSKTCCQAIGTKESVLVDKGSSSLDTSFMGNWVAHLVSTFGSAASGGVKYYQLDNEPDNWQNNRPDVYPAFYPPGTNCMDYAKPIASGTQAGLTPNEDIIRRSIAYAEAVKNADPAAQVLFLSVMNPWDLVNLMRTECGVGTWDPTQLVPYSLTNSYAMAMMAKAAQYEAANHKRVLDCLDTHYPGDAQNFWQTEPLPRVQGWINSTYPGTGICVSEYNVPNDASDPAAAVQEADLLGTFGVAGVRVAAYWGSLVRDDKTTHKPVYGAFSMFRNYDGAGGRFGDVSVGAQSAHPDVHAYAATDSKSDPRRLWIMLVNRGTGSQDNMTITIRNFAAATTAKVYRSVGGAAPEAGADATISNGTISGLSIPANAIVLVAATR